MTEVDVAEALKLANQSGEIPDNVKGITQRIPMSPAEPSGEPIVLVPVAGNTIHRIAFVGQDLGLATTTGELFVLQGFSSAFETGSVDWIELSDGSRFSLIDFLEDFGEGLDIGDMLNSIEAAAGVVGEESPGSDTPSSPPGRLEVTALSDGERNASGALDQSDTPTSPGSPGVTVAGQTKPITDQTLGVTVSSDVEVASSSVTKVTLTQARDNFEVPAGDSANYEVDGMRGRDRITGGDGNDTLRGGRGKDRLFGEDGDDRLEGGQGKDHLYGGAGDDTLIGGTGKDVLSGGDGDDTLILSGQADSRDRLDGGDGHDTVMRGDGDLVLRRFNAANDVEVVDGRGEAVKGTSKKDVLDFSNAQFENVSGIETGAGNDKVIGTDGDDRIFGGSGKDKLSGGAGDDFISGGTGRNILTGGAGGDTFAVGEGVDIIKDFRAEDGDRIDVSSVLDLGEVEDLDAYIRLEEDRNGNTVVKVNESGSGQDSDFSRVAVLEGVTDVSISDILRDGAEPDPTV